MLASLAVLVLAAVPAVPLVLESPRVPAGARLTRASPTDPLGVSIGLPPRDKRRLLTSFQTVALGPQDLRRLYGAVALHARGFAGQRSEVGVVGPIPDSANFPDPADLDWFYKNVSDSSAQFDLVNLGLNG